MQSVKANADAKSAKGGGKDVAGSKAVVVDNNKKDKADVNKSDGKAVAAAGAGTATNKQQQQQQAIVPPRTTMEAEAASNNPGGIFFPPHWDTKLPIKPSPPQTGAAVDSLSVANLNATKPLTQTESDSDITRMEPFSIVTDDLATVIVLLECPELHIVMKVLDNLYKRMDNNLGEKQAFLAKGGLEKVLFYTQHVRMPLVRRAATLVGLLALHDECHDEMLRIEQGTVVPLMLALLAPDMDRLAHESATLALARLTGHSLTRFLLVYDFNGSRLLQQRAMLAPLVDPDIILNTLTIWQHLLEEEALRENSANLPLTRVLDACREQMRNVEFVRLRLVALKIMALAANVKTHRDYLLNLKITEDLKVTLFDEPNCETPDACYALLANLFYDTGVQADFEDSGLFYAVINHLNTYPAKSTAAAAAAAAASGQTENSANNNIVSGINKIAEHAIQMVALASRVPDMAWVMSKKSVEKLLIWFIENASNEQTNVRAWSFVALKHLSDIAASRNAMMQNNVGHAVLKSIAHEVSHDVGMERIMQFISRFAQHDEQCGRYLLDTGVVHEVAQQLRHFNSSSSTPYHVYYLDDARIQASMVAFFTSIGVYARLMRDINNQCHLTIELAHVLASQCDDAPYLSEQCIMALQLYMQQPRARHEFISTPRGAAALIDALGRVRREYLKPLLQVIGMSIVNESVSAEFIRAGAWDRLQTLMLSAACNQSPISGNSGRAETVSFDYLDAANLVRQKLLEGDAAFKFACCGVLSPLNRITHGFYDFAASAGANVIEKYLKPFPSLEEVCFEQPRVVAATVHDHQLPLVVYYISTKEPPSPDGGDENERESQVDATDGSSTPSGGDAAEQRTGQVTSPPHGKKNNNNANKASTVTAGASTGSNNSGKMSRQSTQQQPKDDAGSVKLKKPKIAAAAPGESTGGGGTASSISLNTNPGSQLPIKQQQQLVADEQNTVPKPRAAAPPRHDETTNGGDTSSPVKPAFHPSIDQRLLDFARAVHQELRCYQYLVNRTVILARMVAERMGGGAQKHNAAEPLLLSSSSPTCTSHLRQLRKYLNSHCIPLGYVRHGDFQARALLFKFCADFFHIPCSLHRSSGGTRTGDDGKQQSENNSVRRAPPKSCAAVLLPPLPNPQQKSVDKTLPAACGDIRYWNVVYVGKPSEPFLVDIMFSPGALIPMHAAAMPLVEFYCNTTDKHATSSSNSRSESRNNNRVQTQTLQEYLVQLPAAALKLPYEVPKMRSGDTNTTTDNTSADGDQASSIAYGGSGASGGGAGASSGSKRGRKGPTTLGGDASSITSGASTLPVGSTTTTAAAATGLKSTKTAGLSPGGAVVITGSTLSAAASPGGGAKSTTPSSTPTTTAASAVAASGAKAVKKQQGK